MRYKESAEQEMYLRKASESGHLEPVFNGLDVLSSTPWTINRRVFEVILTAWNQGGAIAEIPAADYAANVTWPAPPDPGENDPAKRNLYLEEIKRILSAQRTAHSERCKFNYNLEVARAYLNDVFYLPHNLDFRGRAYPIPPHLSPVGDDLCRGLLSFGEKKPLGLNGLKWLQIHLANVFGFDKLSFEERARFTQDHEADIFDSADRPLEGKRWWLEAEDPWQCLATCFELTSTLRSPDPTTFESSLPVHQDGTCNGMQHYAALGGDIRGAKAVNLTNGDRPADIYTGVADIANKIIEEDKKNGLEVAKLIGQPLGRKVVKQTVMTTVYGECVHYNSADFRRHLCRGSGPDCETTPQSWRHRHRAHVRGIGLHSESCKWTVENPLTSGAFVYRRSVSRGERHHGLADDVRSDDFPLHSDESARARHQTHSGRS